MSLLVPLLEFNLGAGHRTLFFFQRVKVQSSLPLENFFESLTTAIRYVRYTPGIKILLARHAIFSFFISSGMKA
jgi:Transmembrane secretion effector